MSGTLVTKNQAMADDRTTGLLTDANRELARGEREFDNSNNRSTMVGRLRYRIYRGLEIDGPILSNLDAEVRRKIFRDWENRVYDDLPEWLDHDEMHSRNTTHESFEKNLLKRGIRGWLKFIYLGVQEGNLGDFEELLRDAINDAERDRGRYVSELNLSIRFDTLDEIQSRVEAGEIGFRDLTLHQIQSLMRENRLSDEAESDLFDELERGWYSEKRIQQHEESIRRRLEDLDVD